MSNDFSDLEVVYYIIICYMSRNNKTIDSKHIMEEMYGRGQFPNRASRYIHSSINGLLDKGVIKGIQTSRDSYEIDPSSTYFEGRYAKLIYRDVVKILRAGVKNYSQLVRYYCWLMGSRKGMFGNMKATYFANSLSCDIRTIYRYSQKLEELEVIYIERSNKINIGQNGNIYQDNNIYCSFVDKIKMKV